MVTGGSNLSNYLKEKKKKFRNLFAPQNQKYSSRPQQEYNYSRVTLIYH